MQLNNVRELIYAGLPKDALGNVQMRHLFFYPALGSQTSESSLTQL